MAPISNRNLLAFVLMVCLNLMAHSFNLNEPASFERAPPVAAGASGPARGASVEQALKLKAVYAKILKLFDILKLCDAVDFDIDQVKIPKDWTLQAKAMMVLSKSGKKKLIKESDLARYQRIMNNCNEIDKRVRQRTERSMSLESQFSGMTPDELEKFRRFTEENPLQAIRQRAQEAVEATGRALSPPPMARVRPEVRLLGARERGPRRPPADNLMMSLALVGGPRAAPTFYQFF